MSYVSRQNIGGAIIEETLIDEFDGGMTNNARVRDFRYSRVLRNFDVLTTKNKLVPFGGLTGETFDTGTDATTKLCKMVSANSKLYGLGVVSGQAYPKVFEKTGATGSWVASTTGEDSTGTRSEKLFIEYQDIIYGANYVSSSDTRIFGYAYLTNTFTSTALDLGTLGGDLSASTIAIPAVVHKKTDILYVAHDNYVLKKDGGAVTVNWSLALTLPTNSVIVDMCEYGNYIAIATKSKYTAQNSTLYIWDGDSSLETVTDKADWGIGELQQIEEVEGYLIGISTSPLGITYSNADAKIVFKQYVGGIEGTKQFLEIPISSLTIDFAGKQKVNGRMYFMMSCAISSVQFDGIWSIGRMGTGNFALSFDRESKVTSITSNISKGFFLYGDWMHSMFTDNGAYVINRTRDSGVFDTGTAIYESLIFNNGDSSKKKKLLGVTVMYEPFDSDDVVVMKYKKDEETSFTQIFSDTTNNAVSHDAINIESSAAALPEYKEIQFRLESTKGAAITAYKFKSIIYDKGMY